MNDLPRFFVPAILSLTLAGCDAASEGGGGYVASAPSCEACAIELVQGAQLSSQVAAGSARDPATLVRSADGSYALGPTYEPGTVARFDREGQFEGIVGQYGEGPAEMKEVHEPVGWTGDSLAVLHDRNDVSVYDRAGNYGRTMTLEPRNFITSDISDAAAGTFLARQTGTGGGAHAALRAYATSGEPIRGYGPEVANLAGRNYVGLATAGDTIWAAVSRRYEIDVFLKDQTEAIGTVAPEAEWFPPDAPRNEWGGRPSVLDVAHFAPGELLVLMRRPRMDFELPPPTSRADGPAQGSGRRVDHTDRMERYEQVIELLDLQSGQVSARLVVDDEWVGGFLGSNELFTYHLDEESGQVGVTVWEIRLTGRQAP